MTETLYIIGNGFDLAHGLKTSYNDLKEWISNTKCHKKQDIISTLEKVCEISDPKWSDLEDCLSNFDEDTLTNYYDNDDPFRIGEASFQVEIFADVLLHYLPKAMKEFVLNLQYPEHINELDIDKKALFLTFNYTDTLERYYGIERDKICHIHNKATESNKLVLGHGEEIIEEPKEPIHPPENCSDEEYEAWCDDRSSQESMSYDLAQDKIFSLKRDLYKNSKELIENNSDFFNNLCYIKKIVIMGHSFNEQDMDYFIKIKELVHAESQWNVSFHEGDDNKKFSSILEDCLGISKEKIRTFKL